MSCKFRLLNACKKCNKQFEVRLSEKGRKYCSRACHYADRPKGKEHFNWKGGRQAHSGGYVMLHEHGRQLEHRIVMQNYLNRALSDAEIVHHINGDRTDNRIENLELMSRASHCSLHHKGIPKPKRRKNAAGKELHDMAPRVKHAA